MRSILWLAWACSALCVGPNRRPFVGLSKDPVATKGTSLRPKQFSKKGASAPFIDLEKGQQSNQTPLVRSGEGETWKYSSTHWVVLFETFRMKLNTSKSGSESWSNNFYLAKKMSTDWYWGQVLLCIEFVSYWPILVKNNCLSQYTRGYHLFK